MRKISNIFHVSPVYPPKLGGAEKVVQSLASAQHKLGSSVSVITSDHGSLRNDAVADAFPVVRLRSFVVANTTIILGLPAKLLRLSKGDVAHVHITQAFTPEIVWLASKIRGFKYVAHIHLDVLPSSKAGGLLKIYKPVILKRVLRDASSIVVFTNDQKDNLAREYNIPLEQIEVVPNAAEDKFFYSKKRHLSKKPQLLFVGRLDQQKNIPQLLHALEGISDQFITTLVGDGDLKPKLERLARSLKLKNVSFVGRADGEKLLSYYKKADMFVLPSEREGMPLVLLEAMAMGLPIIATDVTGNSEVVKSSENGLLVPLGDPEALREALLNVKNNPKGYNSMSQSARAMAENHRWARIAAKYLDLYERSAMPKPSATELPKLWHIALPLLILANAAYLSKSFFGWVITLGFFLIIPGYLLLSRLEHGIKNPWEISSLSLGLSLLLLMVGGLLLNNLHMFGLAKPLTTLNVFAVLDITSSALIFLNRRRMFEVKLPKFELSKERVAIISVLAMLPLLAIGGAIRLNNGASDILTMVLFALIAVLFPLLAIRKNLSPIYPYALIMMALSILFSTSLRGWYITGHDIHHEFLIFQSVSDKSYWSPRTAYKDPYNACLSISILPTIVSRITSIPAVDVFKTVFQIIFALGVIPVFVFIKKLSNKTTALIGSFLFLTFPTYLSDMPFLNRQEIAFIFFSLLLLVTFSRMPSRTKNFLTMCMFLGLLLSHYSTNYVAIGLVALSWCFFKLMMRKQKNGEQFHIPLLSMPIIVAALAMSYVWGAVITQTSPSLGRAVDSAAHSLSTGIFVRSNSTEYSLLAPGSQTPQTEFKNFAGKSASQAKYSPPVYLPITKFGRFLSDFVGIRKLNVFVHSLLAKIYQVFLLVGVALMALIYYRRRSNNQRQDEVYLLSLTLSSIVLLILLTFLPQVSVSYSVTRLFEQTLIITALPIIMGIKRTFWFLGRYKECATILLAAVFFLNLSGFLPQITGGYLPQLSLNNSGEYFDFFYTHKSDVLGAEWLVQNRNKSTPVFEDVEASSTLQYIPVNEGLLNNNSPSGYLYEDYTNVTRGIFRALPNNDLVEYSDQNITKNRDLLYASQGTRIYSKSEQ